MVSCLILMILAAAGGSYVSLSATVSVTNRNRCVALARASSRLEEVCATPYGTLTNRPFAAHIAWIKWNGSTWLEGNDETFPIGSSTCPLLTRLSNDTTRLVVTVWAGDRENQAANDIMVRLDTTYAPSD